jgi:hypothetical protein
LPTKDITKVIIRMYRLGTGDCFALKFQSGSTTKATMLIDCGSWSMTYAKINESLKDLKTFFEGNLDTLVVTHEHKDHVVGFQAARTLFQNELKPTEVWFGWTEDDSNSKVKRWKKKYGQRKKALTEATKSLKKAVAAPGFKAQFRGGRDGQKMLGAREQFAESFEEFNSIYVGGQKGMEVVKELVPRKQRRYLRPGKILKNIPGLDGMRIYVLGPPLLHREVKREHGHGTESYEHTKSLPETDLLIHALNPDSAVHEEVTPFDDSFLSAQPNPNYQAESWRRIDHDWLFGSGQLMLRMNSLTNNLSLALAFEFEKSKKVMLFPGDAEFGSWESWHKTIDWAKSGEPDLTTKKLLNRVVFYKVAHHLSHNGTARSLGLDLMNHPELTAMATLDYRYISSKWTRTMPNRGIIKDLLEKTQGRTMIMNTDGLFWDKARRNEPLVDKIQEYRDQMAAADRRAFNRATKVKPNYIEYTLRP